MKKKAWEIREDKLNGLAWTELYNAFSKFAYVARKQKFYEGMVQEMEYSLFKMCPFPKTYRPNTKGAHKNEH
jgi:hypothetical protein